MIETFNFRASRTDDKWSQRTDPDGNVSKEFTHYRGRVTQIIDSANNTTYFDYSISSALAKVTLPVSSENRLINWLTYDSWCLRSENDLNGAVTLLTLMTMRAASFARPSTPYTSPARTTKTREIEYHYDELDRVINEGQIDNTSYSYTNRVTFYYDQDSPIKTNGKGRLTAVIDASGASSYGYDVRGNLATMVIAPTGLNESYTILIWLQR